MKKIHNIVLGPHYGPIVADEYVRRAHISFEQNVDSSLDFVEVFAQEATDYFYSCPGRALARYEIYAQKSTDVRLYVFRLKCLTVVTAKEIFLKQIRNLFNFVSRTYENY